MKRTIKRVVVGACSLIAVAGMTGLTAASANADDPQETFPGGFLIHAQYDAKGSTHITKGNFNVPLGPTKLDAQVGFLGTPENPNDDLGFYATLPLPPKTVKFKAFGYLPVQAKVYFTEVGPVTGTIHVDNEAGTTPTDATASYVVSLRDVKVGGTAAKVGDNCQTRYPLNVTVSSPNLDIFSGGDLTGNYDLGKFNNCKSSTDLINLIVPSNNNTLKLTLGELQVPDENSPSARKLRKAVV